jgi:hypothetical protein
MAISPNTTFFTGYTLTATQLNAFPRGVMGYINRTTTDSSITTQETQLIYPGIIMSDPNRYYRITYYEPQITTPATSGVFVTARIRNFSSIMTFSIVQNQAALATNYSMTTTWVGQFTIGAESIDASLQCSSGTATATRSATAPAYLLVEDLGPA